MWIWLAREYVGHVRRSRIKEAGGAPHSTGWAPYAQPWLARKLRRQAPVMILACMTVLPYVLRGVLEAPDAKLRRRLLQEVPVSDPMWRWYLMISMALLSVSTLMSGLFLGLLSLDPIELEIYRHGGGTEKQKRQADLVWPLVNQKGHRLLVTLLLLNFSANEALPIFLDRLVPAWGAILLSVVLVVFCGEMFPMAVFTGPRQLMLASQSTALVWVLIWVTTPIAYPLAKLLDYMLGENSGLTRYNRQQMHTLVKLHQLRPDKDDANAGLSPGGSVDADAADSLPYRKKDKTQIDDREVKMMTGALSLVSSTAESIMTPFHKIKMIPASAKLDEYTLAGLVSTGHSRIPVYHGQIHNICGFLNVKHLITLDPLQEFPVSSLTLWRPIAVHKDTNLMDMLKMFQEGRSHLAMITPDPELLNQSWAANTPVPPGTIMGLMTCGDVMEQLIGEELQEKANQLEVAQFNKTPRAQKSRGILPTESRPFSTLTTQPPSTNFQNATIKEQLGQAYMNKFDRMLDRSVKLSQGRRQARRTLSRNSSGGRSMSFDTLDLPGGDAGGQTHATQASPPLQHMGQGVDEKTPLLS